MQHEIMNEIHSNPALNSNPVATTLAYASGWVGSAMLMYIGTISEATDLIKFIGAIGGVGMLFISFRRGYLDNKIKKLEIKMKEAELKKKENGSNS